jgi:hypothetical protein
VLGEFNGGRGSPGPGNDVIYHFLVEESGLYPFRLIWQEGAGGANLEWWTLDTAEPTRVYVPINSEAGIPAFLPPSDTDCGELSIRLEGDEVVIEWTGPGALQSAATIDGEWVDEGVESPHQVAATGAQRYYRLICRTGANIVWVSFHSADDSPTTAARDAGFDEAPDKGYTDLLRAAGHNVTRYVSTGTPNTALLNEADLVIISRSVPSGDYQTEASRLAWNGITAPMIHVNGYVLRDSRLGFTTGGTMPDTTNAVHLVANAPNHPIFAGIEIGPGNELVHAYADDVTHNGVVQRGISINHNPLAGGGQLIASLAPDSPVAAGGMVIAEWAQGSVMHSGDALGGPRLVILTGSREQGITSQAAGIYDLTQEGARLFLNAVNYMAQMP